MDIRLSRLLLTTLEELILLLTMLGFLETSGKPLFGFWGFLGKVPSWSRVTVGFTRLKSDNLDLKVDFLLKKSRVLLTSKVVTKP